MIAERCLNRWFGLELSGAFTFADERGRNAFDFDPIESPFVEAADDLILRTPYSRTIVSEALSREPTGWDNGRCSRSRMRAIGFRRTFSDTCAAIIRP